MAAEQTNRRGSLPLPIEAGAPARRGWEVPAFLAGLLAVIAVWIGRPYWRPHRVDPVERDLWAVRQALEEPHADLPQILAQAQQALDEAGPSAPQTGEASFLLGSCYLRLASADTTAAAAEAWQKASEYLQRADQQGVPESDQKRLWYRLARAWFQTKRDPRQIIDYLSRSLDEGADDLGEAYGMLVQAYLRLPQPDINGALEANRKQLALPTDNDDLLVPARLLRGELLLRVHQRAEARLVLSCIKPGAPSDIYARARWLLAMSYQDDEDWKAAAQLWEEILKDRDHPPKEPARILYYLGVCLARHGEETEAATVWEHALPYGGEAGQAAAFRLAASRLRKNTTQAWKAYQRALRDLTPGHYQNALVPLREARRICEEGCAFYGQIGDYPSAYRLAQMYGPLAPPARAHRLRAEALDAWAEDLKGRSRRAGNESAAHRDEAAAREHYREAGAAYEAAAAAAPVQDRADYLWRSAQRYRQCQDEKRAEAVLKQLVRLDLPGERLAEGWYTLGLVYQSLHRDDEAQQAFHQCISLPHPGPFAYRARYQLAELEIQQGQPDNLDQAEAILTQNLHLMDFAPDSEAEEKTLLALAGLKFQRGDYRLAALRLQVALDRYPANARALSARYVLADCYRRLAAQKDQSVLSPWPMTEEARLHYRRQYLKMAAANFQKLTDDLLTRAAKRPLAEDQASLLRQAAFAEAECQFELGTDHSQEAIRLYEILAARYHHQAESLDALLQITRCYWVQQQPEKALKTLDRIRDTLKDMDDAAIRRSAINQTRQEWQEWLVRAVQLSRPTNAGADVPLPRK